MKKYTLFFVFLMLCASTFAQEIVRGPYLQSGTPETMIVKWRTNEAIQAKINYGTEADNLSKSVSLSSSETDHEIKIPGLKPATKYYYTIANVAGAKPANQEERFFITAPEKGVQHPTKLWVLGDSGTANEKARAVRDAFYDKYGKTYAELVLMLGDNAYDDGKDDEYQAAMFENMYEDVLANTVVWPTPGNHDLRKGLNSPYYDIFSLPTQGEAGGLASGTESYYAFDYGNIHLISLNSEGEEMTPDSDMYAWLEQDLAMTDSDWLVVFFHHPPYSFGSHDSDESGTQTDAREYILPLLEAAGVDLVMAGHSHIYERSYLINGHYGKSNTFDDTMLVDGGDGKKSGNGVYKKMGNEAERKEGAVYMVAGSAGKVSKPDQDVNHPVMISALLELGSVVIDVDGNDMNVEFLMADGSVGDYFTLSKDLGNFIPETPDEDIAEEINFQLYPNPAIDQITLDFELEEPADVSVNVFDANGRQLTRLKKETLSTGNQLIELDMASAYAKGVYFVQTIIDGLGSTSRKVIIP